MKENTIKLLDITVNGGRAYNAVGVYTSERRAKKSVKEFIEKYNNTRDIEKGEVEYKYDDNIWFTTEGKELVFPFGPNAEFRLRKLNINQPITTKD